MKNHDLFPLLTDAELELIPKSVLLSALNRSTFSGSKTLGFYNISNGPESKPGPNMDTYLLETNSEFIVTGEKNQIGDKFFFSLGHWAMSARTEWSDSDIKLMFAFDHRTRRDGRPSSLAKSFLEDLSRFDFTVHLTPVGVGIFRRSRAKGKSFHRTPFSLCQNSFEMDLNWEHHGKPFRETVDFRDYSQLYVCVSIEWATGRIF